MRTFAPTLRRNAFLQALVLVSLMPSLCFYPTSVRANPSGAVVAAGNVQFSGFGTSNLDIMQGSSRAIINWQSFSIAQGETTRFIQPNGGVALNRVVGGNVSEIYGSLQANGGVVLINPNGVVVGPSGTIDVAGLLALSTLDTSNSEFLNGGPMRFRGSSGAGVRNYGAISSQSGDVVLLGNFLHNHGSVSAPSGTVAFGAGGDILLEQTASGATISVHSGGNDSHIDNTGSVTGAAAEFKAHGNAYSLAVQNSGVVRANGYNFTGGKLTLSGGSQGSVVNTGTLSARNADGSGGQVNVSGGRVEIGGVVDASAVEVGQAGGSVNISGSEVVVAEAASVAAVGSAGGSVSVRSAGDATIDGSIGAIGSSGLGGNVTIEGRDISVGSHASVDVSGETGGGDVRIGGGFQGRDETIMNSDTLMVASGAQIRANAVGSGRGGNIILWSDQDTLFAGDLSATGVSKGGFAEISGRESLAVTGRVDLTASAGAAGTLLLDPTNIMISALGDSGLGGSTISNLWLSEQLDMGHNVIISTNFGAGGEAGDITIGRTDNNANSQADRVLWYQNEAGTPGGTLTLLAMGDIRFNTAVQSAGEGGLNVVAGWDGVTGWSGPDGGESGTFVFDINAILATMNNGNAADDAAGLGGGSVYVGAVNARTGVGVGSRWGDTNVAGHDVILRGSISVGHGWAQLGFTDSGVEYELSRAFNGLVINEWWGNAAGNPQGKDYIALLGGTEFGTGDIDGLGHNAFRGAGWGATGNITVAASGRVDARGGTTSSYTQIGHGGVLADGSQWKRDQTVNGVANTLIVTTRDGIQIDPGTNRRSFFASTWRTNYAGDAARIDADISVTADGDILMMAARGFEEAGGYEDELNINATSNIYSMIGHGGVENQGSYHGDIAVTALGSTTAIDGNGLRYQGEVGIQILGGRGTRSFAMIGHGSGYEGNHQSVWDQSRSGDINVTATTGAILLKGHNQAIRDGNANTGDLIDGDTRTPLGNSSDNSTLGSFVQIGHGGQNSSLPVAGGSFIMPNGTNVNNIAPDGSMTGAINVYAGGTYMDPTNSDSPIGILVRAGNRRWFHAQIGHGGTNHNAINAADQTPDFGPDAIMPNLGPDPYVAPTLATSTGYHGDIRVEADKGDVIVAGGDSFRADRSWGWGFNFARVGHGGDVVRGDKGGTITVLAGQGAGAVGGAIHFTAGRMNRSHAHLGHGGYDSAGDILGPENSAEIIVTARGDISFVSPEAGESDALGLSADYAAWWYGSTGSAASWSTDNRFVMLGHGGRSSVTVMPNRQDITVTSGTGDVGNADGDPTTGGILFVAGNDNRDFAHLGHGGYASSANNEYGFTGDININALGGGIVFDASMIGKQAVVRTTSRSIDGIGNVVAVAEARGAGVEAYAQIGHGGYASRGIHTGDININAWGGIEFLGAQASGLTSHVVTDPVIGAALENGTYVWVNLGGIREIDSTHASAFDMPSLTSNIVPGSVRIELSDGTFITDVVRLSEDDRRSDPSGGDANAGLFLDGEKIGDIYYDFGIMRIQKDGVAGSVLPDGVTFVEATFDTYQGQKERAYVQLGHGGYDADGPNNKANDLLSNLGDISIRAGGDIRFEAGSAHRSYAQLGHGGYDTRGINAGNITIDHIDAGNPLGQVGGLRFIAGHGGHRQYDSRSYAQFGHGGYAASGNHYGNIFIRGTEDADGMGLFFKAGNRQDAYVHLGHGGRSARSGTGNGDASFGLNGDIDIEVSGDVAFVAGTFTTNTPDWDEDGRLYALLGHGGWDADPSNNNTNNFGQSRLNPEIPVGTAGAGDGNWGHFGDIRLVTTGGNMSFMAGSNIPVADRLDVDGNPLALPNDPNGFLTSFGDGRGRFHLTQIGHGGYATSGDHFGNITLIAEDGGVHVVGGMLSVDNSTAKYNSSQIGHGSAESSGNVGRADDRLEVFALGSSGNVVVIGGEGQRTGAQIGHGGYNNGGTKEGFIQVVAGNHLIMNSGSGVGAEYNSKIGHGGHLNLGSGQWNGDIHVSIGESLFMGQALLGHTRGDFRSSNGDTFVAVSRNNPFGGGGGRFVTTSRSILSSASEGFAGELRLYMPDPSANEIAEGTSLNSRDYTRVPEPDGTRADESLAVEHQFAEGPGGGMEAAFTPEGNYAASPFGLYMVFYGGDAPMGPPIVVPPVVERPAEPGFTFEFAEFFDPTQYDAYDRYMALLEFDGYGDGLLDGISIEDALDDEANTRRRRGQRKAGVTPTTFYVYQPGTNQYSSYSLFGVPETRLPSPR